MTYHKWPLQQLSIGRRQCTLPFATFATSETKILIGKESTQVKLISKHNSPILQLELRMHQAYHFLQHIFFRIKDHNQLSLLDPLRHPRWVVTQSPSPLSLRLYGANLNRTNARLYISKCDTQYSQHRLVSS